LQVIEKGPERGKEKGVYQKLGRPRGQIERNRSKSKTEETNFERLLANRGWALVETLCRKREWDNEEGSYGEGEYVTGYRGTKPTSSHCRGRSWGSFSTLLEDQGNRKGWVLSLPLGGWRYILVGERGGRCLSLATKGKGGGVYHSMSGGSMNRTNRLFAT